MKRGAIFGTAVSIFVGVAALASGCSSSKNDTPAPSGCTPGKSYYCRCADRSEGTWTCIDGRTFDECQPCAAPLPDPIPDPPSETEDAGPLPRCGDGVVDPGEDCDDANTNDTDGCNQQCKLAGSSPPAARACPGLPVHVWGTQKATYVGWTTGAPNTGAVTPACPGKGTNVTGERAPDRVFFVTAHTSGTMTVATRGTSFDNLIYATTQCKDRSKEGPSTSVACVNEVSTTEGETLKFPVESGQTFTVFVDGSGTAAGNVTVDFSIL